MLGSFLHILPLSCWHWWNMSNIIIFKIPVLSLPLAELLNLFFLLQKPTKGVKSNSCFGVWTKICSYSSTKLKVAPRLRLLLPAVKTGNFKKLSTCHWLWRYWLVFSSFPSPTFFSSVRLWHLSRSMWYLWLVLTLRWLLSLWPSRGKAIPRACTAVAPASVPGIAMDTARSLCCHIGEHGSAAVGECGSTTVGERDLVRVSIWRKMRLTSGIRLSLIEADNSFSKSHSCWTKWLWAFAQSITQLIFHSQ